MSENTLDYAQMIEIPVSTCTVTYKRNRKKKKRREDLQNKLLDKVNKTVNDELPKSAETNSSSELPVKENIHKAVKHKQSNNDFQEKGRINVVMLEFIIVCMLCAVIFLTNIFIPDSGINTFLRNTLMLSDTVVEDTREYSVFDASVPVKSDSLTVEEGVMTFSGSDSVYAPCDGTISSITQSDDNLYIIEIAHNSNFKTIISGVSYAYYNAGDSVYSSIPVGYVKDGTAKAYMYNNGSLLSNFSLENGSIIWQV